MYFENSRITLDERQFKFLLDPQSFLLLSYFTESRNPSEVAKEMNIPANILHYHVKRAVQLRLLTVTEQIGRRRRYRLAAEKFRIPLDILPLMSEATPLMLRRVLTKIQRGFSQELSYLQENLYEGAYNEGGKRFVDFDLRDSVSVKAFFPAMQLLEIRLRPAQYISLVETLTRELTNAQETVSAEGELCTFVIVAYRGSVSKQDLEPQ